jgi:hypothetical protein
MTDRDSLDALSSRELHHLAVHRAVRHVDVGFLWELLKEIPAAETVAGHPGEANADVMHLSALLSDLIDSGDADVAESLRPLYVSYLQKHPDALPGG